jgi:hypothetical protein
VLSDDWEKGGSEAEVVRVERIEEAFAVAVFDVTRG